MIQHVYVRRRRSDVEGQLGSETRSNDLSVLVIPPMPVNRSLTDLFPLGDPPAGLLPASIGQGPERLECHADVRPGRTRFAIRDGLRVNVTP